MPSFICGEGVPATWRRRTAVMPAAGSDRDARGADGVTSRRLQRVRRAWAVQAECAKLRAELQTQQRAHHTALERIRADTRALLAEHDDVASQLAECRRAAAEDAKARARVEGEREGIVRDLMALVQQQRAKLKDAQVCCGPRSRVAWYALRRPNCCVRWTLARGSWPETQSDMTVAKDWLATVS